MFRKKPIEIEAIQWNGGKYDCLNDFCGMNWGRADAHDMGNFEDVENVVVWNMLEKQWLNVPVGHWIIRGRRGELYSCEPKVFEKTYESCKIESPEEINRQ